MMNKNQLEFLVGRFGWKLIPVASLSGAAGWFSVIGDDKSITHNLTAAGFAAGLGIMGSCCLVSSFKDYKKRKRKELNKETHSLEQPGTVFIEDNQGLEHLLERTSHSEKLEWGTLVRSIVFNKQYKIYEIIDSYEAEKRKLITERKCNAVNIHPVMEYNGIHHYHPDGENNESNFIINSVDKFLIGDLHLLTFNMDYGPEIIAFNWKNVYIPEDKKAPKNKLYKASWKQIYKYLK